ncbi:MAG: flagellar basal body-associated FliL family protein [Alphaproteobacteria bacterium]
MAEDFEDADDGGGGGAAPRKKMAGKTLVFILLGVIVLLGGGAAGAYFAGLLDPLLGKHAAEGEAAAPEAPPKPEATAPGYFIDLDEMLVSLSGGSGRSKANFLKLRVSLEVEDKSYEVRIKDVMPRIKDNFQVFLREVRLEELEGSNGLFRVKEELLSRVNTAVYPAKVKAVLIREMLVQ